MCLCVLDSNSEASGGSNVGGIVAGVMVALIIVAAVIAAVVLGIWLWRYGIYCGLQASLQYTFSFPGGGHVTPAPAPRYLSPPTHHNHQLSTRSHQRVTSTSPSLLPGPLTKVTTGEVSVVQCYVALFTYSSSSSQVSEGHSCPGGRGGSVPSGGDRYPSAKADVVSQWRGGEG